MRNTAKITTAVLAAGALTLGLGACGSDKDSGSGSAAADTSGPLVVAASPVPHAEILTFVKDNLAKDAGLDLEVKEFTDYVTPNTATEDGSVGANYFQNQPYLDDFNKKNGTHVVPVVTVHLEPLGLYSHKFKSVEALKNGATVAVPNDTVNEARALKLLAANGLITLKDGAGNSATPADISENPKNLKFKELEAAQTRAPWTTWTPPSSTATTPSRPTSSPRRTPSSWSPPRTTRTATSSPSRRATRTTRA